MADLCVDDHNTESPHCLLTNISRDNYSGRPLGKIFLKICGNATKTFFTEKLTFLILLLFKALHGQLLSRMDILKRLTVRGRKSFDCAMPL